MLNIDDIRARIPHREPFLLVDSVSEITEQTCAAHFTVDAEHIVFQGHFPGKPIWPGVLIVEGLAQTGCVFYAEKFGLPSDKLVVFAGIDKVRFRRPVLPGERLDYSVSLTLNRGAIFKFTGEATVNGERCCNAEMMASIVDRNG